MLRFTLVITALISILVCSAVAENRQPNISQIKIKSMTKQQYLDIRTGGFDILEAPGPDIEIFATQADLERLEAMGVDYETTHQNLADFYTTRNVTMATFGGFKTFSQIEAHLDLLAASFPHITTEKFSIGQSIEGRQQWVIKISDNPDIDEDEPEVFYNSLIHAREPASAAALLYFMEHILANYGIDPQVTELVNNRELYFLLVINPDGYVYNELIAPEGGGMWRKNRRYNYDGSFGVDLNRNFSYEWGFDNLGSSPVPASTTYRGLMPFSEPETQNIRNFVASRNFVIIYNMHCYSNLEIWPPGYNRIWDLEEDFYCNLGDSLTQYNHYTPYVGWALYPTNGGTDDWGWLDIVTKPRSVSLTVEIGSSSDGFWPNPTRIPVLCEENLYPCLYLAQIADNPFVIAPPKTPTIWSPELAHGEYQVQWKHEDDINPAVRYRLMEYSGRQMFTDDAESDYGYWDSDNMTISTARSYSGNASWHSDNMNGERHWLISQTPYEVKPSDRLVFWVWYDIEEDYDYFYAQISTDGGFNYVNLQGPYTTNDDPHNLNLGNGMTGSSMGWLRLDFDLSAYEGQQAIFRLAYFTDDYTLLEGVYIDDIENVEMFQSAVEISSAVTDTFFTFTTKSDGEYWYRVSAIDDAGQESRQSAYTFTQVQAVVCCLISGDVDRSGRLDLRDVQYFIGWMFNGGPEPPCLEEGDTNGDLTVDLRDLQLIIDYLFRSGQTPVECHPLE